MERIAHPRGPEPKRREALVVLDPELFILQCVCLSKFAGDIPCQWINLPAFLHILDDDGQVGSRPEAWRQAGIDGDQAIEERGVVVNVPQVGGVVGVDDVEIGLGAALALSRGAAGVERVKTYSDHRDAAFGLAYGVLIKELRLLARAVQQAMGADGVFVGINNHVSQSVPHLHVHVVPRTKGDGLKGFFWPRTRYASDEETERAREWRARWKRRAIRSGP